MRFLNQAKARDIIWKSSIYISGEFGAELCHNAKPDALLWYSVLGAT